MSSAIKDSIKAIETRLAALEEKIASLSVGGAEKKSRKSKSSSSDSEKEKKVREVKPSEARDAWRSLCDAVRAVHKKDAMKIAKLLKEEGHMEPTAEQINAAIAKFGGDGAASVAAAAASASEAEASASEAEQKPKVRKPRAKKD